MEVEIVGVGPKMERLQSQKKWSIYGIDHNHMDSWNIRTMRSIFGLDCSTLGQIPLCRLIPEYIFKYSVLTSTQTVPAVQEIDTSINDMNHRIPCSCSLSLIVGHAPLPT